MLWFTSTNCLHNLESCSRQGSSGLTRLYLVQMGPKQVQPLGSLGPGMSGVSGQEWLHGQCSPWG